MSLGHHAGLGEEAIDTVVVNLLPPLLSNKSCPFVMLFLKR